jgi:20S proteasome alpha/beta subunit
MTTIAYRDGVVACDSLVTEYERRVPIVLNKVIRLGDKSLLAVCGDAACLLPFARWLNSGCDKPQLPSESCVIHFKNDGSICEYSESGHLDYECEYMSWGSGSGFANVALNMGSSAKGAVHEASKVDIYTGGDIHEFKVNED